MTTDKFTAFNISGTFSKDIAKNLCTKCEEWAKNKGCKEFASDCTLTNTDSIRFHLNIGFQEANRIIHFKKTL